MGHDPKECTVPQCIDCRKATGAVDRSGSGSGDADRDDDTPERAAGGRLVKVDDPRKKDPADAEPLPSGRLSDDDVAELRAAFDRAADASAPDADELARIERDIERRRGRSKVDLTERDIEEARMSTREQLLEALEGLAGIQKDTGATLRKQDGDDDGEHGLREQDLIGAVASLLDGVSEAEVRDAFAELRDDDDDRDALTDAVAEHLDIPRDDAAALLDELDARGGDDDTGPAGDGDDTGGSAGGDDTARSKATVRKSLGAHGWGRTAPAAPRS